MVASSRMAPRRFRASRQLNRTPTVPITASDLRSHGNRRKARVARPFSVVLGCRPAAPSGSAVRPLAIARIDGRPNNETDERAASSRLRGELPPAGPAGLNVQPFAKLKALPAAGRFPPGPGTPSDPHVTARRVPWPSFRDHAIPHRLQDHDSARTPSPASSMRGFPYAYLHNRRGLPWRDPMADRRDHRGSGPC
jgi:hypothetical protein